MNYEWTCPQCGGHTNHFSRNRNGLVCDSCGTQVQTQEERSENLLFERSMVLARDHLKVGNWEEAKKLVKPFCDSRPADKQLYLMLLVSVTKCFTDYLFNNEAKRKEAAEYWDKLERLGCVNSSMKEYAEQRGREADEAKAVYMAKKGVARGISLFLTVITICLIVSGENLMWLFGILTVISWITAESWMKPSISQTDLQMLSGGYSAENPFR